MEVENWKTPIEEDYEADRKFVQKAREKTGKIKSNVNKLREDFKGKMSFLNSKPRKGHCGWAFYKTFITVDGYVTPCCIRMDPTVLNFGNIFTKDNFDNIWNGKKMKKFRKKRLEDSYVPVCENCPD